MRSREDLVDELEARLCMRGAWLRGAAIYRQREGEATCVLAAGRGWVETGEGRRAGSGGRETKHHHGGPLPPVVVSVVAEYIKAGTAIANGICAPHAGDGRAWTRLN